MDISIAHLNGAPAKRTWVLLAFVPDTRRPRNRDGSSWYRAVTFYREGGKRSWAGVLTRLGADLTPTFAGA